ncbi:uncharacterized protein EI90DRAFT_2973437, partial [Cantharellus anzutake]|uniref:uncharacterized protein n=1 Tax=Cantharellus anzutake TaxID=1750568 RepID=UPI0019063A90
NIVSVFGLDNFCAIVPKDPHTDIGVAEGSGTKTYCTDKARYDKVNQGRLPIDFIQPGQAKFAVWGIPGKNQTRQITGCINASHLSRLNPRDQGGQFDKRGFYVQQIEPANNRFCLRCCEVCICVFSRCLSLSCSAFLPFTTHTHTHTHPAPLRISEPVIKYGFTIPSFPEFFESP